MSITKRAKTEADLIRKTREIGTYGISLASGNIDNHTYITKYSTNESVSTAWEDVWSAGGSLTYLTAAATLEAISTSTNDTAAGTGAREIYVEGLDGNFNVVSATITMNGTSASTATTQTFIRVYRAYVTEVGAYGNRNAGTITIRVSGAGSTQAEIPLIGALGSSQTLMSQYTIPAGYTGYIVGMHLAVSAGKTVNINLEFRLNANNTTTYSPWRVALHLHDAGGDASLIPPIPFVIPEYTDIRARGIVDATDAELSFDYQIVLASNNS